MPRSEAFSYPLPDLLGCIYFKLYAHLLFTGGNITFSTTVLLGTDCHIEMVEMFHWLNSEKAI